MLPFWTNVMKNQDLRSCLDNYFISSTLMLVRYMKQIKVIVIIDKTTSYNLIDCHIIEEYFYYIHVLSKTLKSWLQKGDLWNYVVACVRMWKFNGLLFLERSHVIYGNGRLWYCFWCRKVENIGPYNCRFPIIIHGFKKGWD